MKLVEGTIQGIRVAGILLRIETEAGALAWFCFCLRGEKLAYEEYAYEE
jgi:hypothetical protein